MKLTGRVVSMHARVTLTGLLLGAATLSPVVVFADPSPTPAPSGQPTATQTVDIKDGKKPAAAAATKEAPVNVPKKIVSDRDPFVNMTSGGSSSITKTGTATSSKDLVKKGVKGKKGEEVAKAPEPEIPPPNVTVQGILLSHTGNRAILSSPNQTYIVRTGDKLGDYKVAAVVEKSVTFAFKDKKFKLKLKDEFGGVGTPGSKKGGGKK